MKYFLLLFILLLIGCSAQVDLDSTLDLPVLDIEHLMEVSESEDLLLGSITNLLVDSDGDLILVDGSQRYVYAVNAEGEFIQQVGARGSGPGEYEFPGIVQLADDNSIHLFDWGSRSMIVYTKNNGVWSFSSDFTADFNQYGFFTQFFTAANNQYYIVTSPMRIDEEDSKLIVRKIDNTGGLVQDSVYVFPQNERFTVFENGMPRMSMTIPSMHRQGRFYADYTGNTYFGWTDSLTIFRRALDEQEFTPILNSSIKNTPFTSSTRDTLLSNYENLLSENNQARRDLISSFPDTKPVYSDFKVDDNGRIWVQIFNEEEGTDWFVFSSEGEPMYRAELPDGYRLHAVRHNMLYTVNNTEDGIPVVNIFSYNF
ncbi:MAG: 6-bladed beta-propeller [Balneolaceae bacterium]|nr:MAG: 6-bladed beta-propeller [Balneolaceae bacterium]